MSDNISLSEDRLRAILAEFKLDLIERLTRELSRKADLAHVDAVEKRLEVLETHGSREAREAVVIAKAQAAELDRLGAWKNRLIGAFTLISAIVIPTALVVLNQVLHVE